jgi:Protein of unknown function (DUF3082)
MGHFMTDPKSSSNVALAEPTPAPLGPWRCFSGSAVAGGITVVLYKMTSAIALSFATKVIHSDNVTTLRISAAVRTLVVGLSALGTGIFGLAALGLCGLGIQLWFQRPSDVPPENS